jgi:hypothetical protein
MIWDEWQKYSLPAMLWIVHNRIERLEDSLHTANIMIRKIKRNEDQIMLSLNDIEAKVEAEKTVEDSMMVLLDSINQQLKEAIANDDPAAMQEIVDMLDNNTRVMAEKVTANTPAAPGGDTDTGGDTGTGDTSSGDTGTDTTGDTTSEPQP